MQQSNCNVMKFHQPLQKTNFGSTIVKHRCHPSVQLWLTLCWLFQVHSTQRNTMITPASLCCEFAADFWAYLVPRMIIIRRNGKSCCRHSSQCRGSQLEKSTSEASTIRMFYVICLLLHKISDVSVAKSEQWPDDHCTYKLVAYVVVREQYETTRCTYCCIIHHERYLPTVTPRGCIKS